MRLIVLVMFGIFAKLDLPHRLVQFWQNFQTSRVLYLFSFVETPRKFIVAELLIRKLGSSSVLISSDLHHWYY